MKAAIGVAIGVAHAIGFVALAQHCTGTPLRVDLTGPLTFDGTPTIAARVSTDAGPGLRHRTWTASYRGGFTREVGASQLVGPFQDPAAPACSGRVVIELEQRSSPEQDHAERRAQLVGHSIEETVTLAS